MPDLPAQSDTGLTTRTRILIALAVVAVVLVAGHVAYGSAENDLGKLIVLLSAIAGLLLLACIPLVLAWFVWHFILRRMWRVRHMRQKHMDRLIREAAARGVSAENEEQK